MNQDNTMCLLCVYSYVIFFCCFVRILFFVGMGKGKLILICQSGGKFVTDDDGTMTYTGGEAEAIDINHETSFHDFKLKLAKLWNLDFDSLSLKYFLPGNRTTLITMRQEKDMKRMYDFHLSSVSAEVFVTGQEGFHSQAPANWYVLI